MLFFICPWYATYCTFTTITKCPRPFTTVPVSPLVLYPINPMHVSLSSSIKDQTFPWFSIVYSFILFLYLPWMSGFIWYLISFHINENGSVSHFLFFHLSLCHTGSICGLSLPLLRDHSWKGMGSQDWVQVVSVQSKLLNHINLCLHLYIIFIRNICWRNYKETKVFH